MDANFRMLDSLSNPDGLKATELRREFKRIWQGTKQKPRWRLMLFKYYAVSITVFLQDGKRRGIRLQCRASMIGYGLLSAEEVPARQMTMTLVPTSTLS
ncbi:MAG: hypothetical protein QHC90_07670 [Shinella sp.]|nr:hypothetical protein [Shinella sp.]